MKLLQKFTNGTTRNRKMKMAALTVTQVVALAVPPLALLWFTDAVWLVLLALASYVVAGLVRRALRGPTGYVCRYCGTDMTASVCVMGHTHEAITVSPGGAA